MKTLQTTQKRPYTSPFIEVLEAENDMKFLMASATINDPAHYATRQDFISEPLEGDEGFKDY